jgi:hypothetical protein
MIPESVSPTWWELHLRTARGESLSDAERQIYEAELARHDQEAPPLGDLDTLRQLRTAVAELTQENTQLRGRRVQLETEIQAVERALSRQTRDLLGVSE